MRAVVVRHNGDLQSPDLAEAEEPSAGVGQVLISVHSADVNFPDTMMVEGTYQLRPPLPFTPGMAAAGTIIAIGRDVQGWRVGDRVLAVLDYGAFAEKIAVPATSCHRLPDALSFEKAAAMGLVYLTAYFALFERARIQPGETVLILGAKGGIGVASTQIARALGAGKVIAGVRDEDKVSFALTLGADHVVDLGADDLQDNLRDEVHQLTDGRGVDVVIDPVGGELTQAALRAMAFRGRLVVIGYASGDIPEIPTNYLLLKNIAVLGLQLADFRHNLPEDVAAAQARLFEFYRQGRIDPFVSLTLPLERFSEALDRIREGRVMGKVVLNVARR